ncbi:helix-turn-helix transcriptional regulator [Serratia sp. UGAL515B_01]|uniref:helix-turn-helix domain-containing protein n=1 Tax=Serratia sp. UGAL515B_01 TaxID=2986763 RepID=UPI0029552951|nr:helix-turn-helix transcriptional regulator [Serratia sp. UGAL515B_01]WON76968.1 helix-turn-helix transcriptional regulator [Serratia sp. UGAL515B_01]
MQKIFLWCDCHYTKMGLLSLFSEVLHNNIEVINYDRTHSDISSDVLCFFFVISGGNFFEIAEFIRNSQIKKDNALIALSDDELYNVFSHVCNEEIKNISIQKSPIEISNIFKFIISDNEKKHRKTVSKITKKELQVMELFMRGKKVSEVASILHRSIKTISYHKQNFLKKLGIRNNLVVLQSLFLLK